MPTTDDRHRRSRRPTSRSGRTTAGSPPNYPGIQYADGRTTSSTARRAFRFEYTGSLAFTDAQKQTTSATCSFRRPSGGADRRHRRRRRDLVASRPSPSTRTPRRPSSTTWPARRRPSTRWTTASCRCCTPDVTGSERQPRARRRVRRRSRRSTRTTATCPTSTGPPRRCSTRSAASCSRCSPAR